MLDKKKTLVLLSVVVVLIVTLVVLLLTLSAPPSDVPSNTTSGEPVPTTTASSAKPIPPIEDDRVVCTATVLNVREGAVLAYGDFGLCWVRTTVQSDTPVPTIAIGDVIDVVFNGVVAESYPGQINFVYAIRLAEGEHPPLTYTFLPEPSEQKTLTEVMGDVYSYGLDSMDVTVLDQTLSLQFAMAVGMVSPEYLLAQAQADAQAGKCQTDTYDDGGSELYRYEDYAILQMNTIDGDRSLIIGTPDLTPDVI